MTSRPEPEERKEGEEAPRVSVCFLTYNHARYVSQALNGALRQETSFPFEICIGEDESSDGTREICEEYAVAHPGRIRLFLRSRQDVIRIDGRPTGRFNLLQTLKECRGEYIALLDGDDLWTSASKLQRQCDYLDAHPGVPACGHAVISIDEKGQPHSYRWDPPDDRVVTTSDLLRRNCFPTCSSMFRREIVASLPRWMRRVPMADWPLHILLSLRGDLHFLPEQMAAYRMHPGGLWSGLSFTQRLAAEVAMLRIVCRELPRSLRPAARDQIRERQKRLWRFEPPRLRRWIRKLKRILGEHTENRKV